MFFFLSRCRAKSPIRGVLLALKPARSASSKRGRASASAWRTTARPCRACSLSGISSSRSRSPCSPCSPSSSCRRDCWSAPSHRDSETGPRDVAWDLSLQSFDRVESAHDSQKYWIFYLYKVLQTASGFDCTTVSARIFAMCFNAERVAERHAGARFRRNRRHILNFRVSEGFGAGQFGVEFGIFCIVTTASVKPFLWDVTYSWHPKVPSFDLLFASLFGKHPTVLSFDNVPFTAEVI